MTPVIKKTPNVRSIPGLKKRIYSGTTPANITEYAEAYQVAEAGTLYGAYFVTPPAGANYKQMEVEVTVYSGDSKPLHYYIRRHSNPPIAINRYWTIRLLRPLNP